jgi:hypothetical protein
MSTKLLKLIDKKHNEILVLKIYQDVIWAACDIIKNKPPFHKFQKLASLLIHNPNHPIDINNHQEFKQNIKPSEV